MNDPDRVLLEADPAAGYDLDDARIDLALNALRAEIEAEPPEPAAQAMESSRGRNRRAFTAPRLVAAILMGAVVAIAIVLIPGGSSEGGTESAYAAEAIKIAEANRRLLVDQPGWRIEFAHFESPTYGEVEFGDEMGLEGGGDYLQTAWYPSKELESRTRSDGAAVEIAGEDGFFYRVGDDEFNAVLPPLHGAFMLISGSASSGSEFRNRLESMISVDVDTWLQAMPQSVVLPRDQHSAIDELLRGVPLPPGFDLAAIASKGLPEDEFQLKAYVLRGVYCGWLDRWWSAEQAGDDAVAQAAVAELLNAENWPAIAEDAAKSPLDNDFRQYAKTVARGDGDKQVYDQMENCIEYP